MLPVQGNTVYDGRAQGAPLSTSSQVFVRSLSFSPSTPGLLATCGDNSTVKLWDLNKRTAVHVLAGHEQEVLALAFTADGRRLISGGDDSEVPHPFHHPPSSSNILSITYFITPSITPSITSTATCFSTRHIHRPTFHSPPTTCPLHAA